LGGIISEGGGGGGASGGLPGSNGTSFLKYLLFSSSIPKKNKFSIGCTTDFSNESFKRFDSAT
jgi:hypothetical protein